MVFSQIRTETARDVLNQAKMRGIETHVLREEGDWTTLQFTSHYSKLSFDEMARQMGVNIHGDGPTIQMMDALDAVSEGANPNKVLGMLYESGFTRGMVNAYARGPFKYVCASESCGVTIPSYRGRYPSSCPSCGSGLMTAEQWEQRRARRESAQRRRVKESTNEAVKVDTSDWDRSHAGSKKASGGWMFSFVDPRGKDTRSLEKVSYNGSYSDAVRKAQEAAKLAGHDTVYVLA